MLKACVYPMDFDASDNWNLHSIYFGSRIVWWSKRLVYLSPVFGLDLSLPILLGKNHW